MIWNSQKNRNLWHKFCYWWHLTWLVATDRKYFWCPHFLPELQPKPRKLKILKPEDEIVIIYNRVPKTGSTSFIGLAYSLCAANKFNVIHINTTKNAAVLSLPDQVGLKVESHLTNYILLDYCLWKCHTNYPWQLIQESSTLG